MRTSSQYGDATMRSIPPGAEDFESAATDPSPLLDHHQAYTAALHLARHHHHHHQQGISHGMIDAVAHSPPTPCQVSGPPCFSPGDMAGDLPYVSDGQAPHHFMHHYAAHLPEHLASTLSALEQIGTPLGQPQDLHMLADQQACRRKHQHSLVHGHVQEGFPLAPQVHAPLPHSLHSLQQFIQPAGTASDNPLSQAQIPYVSDHASSVTDQGSDEMCEGDEGDGSLSEASTPTYSHDLNMPQNAAYAAPLSNHGIQLTEAGTALQALILPGSSADLDDQACEASSAASSSDLDGALVNFYDMNGNVNVPRGPECRSRARLSPTPKTLPAIAPAPVKASKSPAEDEPTLTEEAKRRLRIVRNRESAERSRMKKRNAQAGLERRVRRLAHENTVLRQALESIQPGLSSHFLEQLESSQF